MMKLMRFLLILMIGVLSSTGAIANNNGCSIKGQRDFTISFTVVGSQNTQFFDLTQGNKFYRLWYTGSEQSDSNYIFNDQTIASGTTYRVRITYDHSQLLLSYYRDSGNGWTLIEQQLEEIKSGNYWAAYSSGVSSTDCGESLNPPPPEMNICDYVPNGLQTNKYASGVNLPLGAMQVSALIGNKIYPYQNDPQYSFSAIVQANDLCQYPDGNVGACTYDRTKLHSTLPMPTPDFDEGDDEFECDDGETCPISSGYYEEITIGQNAQLQLLGGHYWVDELKFDGPSAQIEVLAPSIIHYKEIEFEGPNVRINQSGDSHDLLFIGHGEDSQVKIPDFSDDDDDSGGSVDINFIINAFFYVDHNSDDDTNGFIINGSNNLIRGGITAHSIAISGRNNQIHALSCEPGPDPEPDVASIVLKPYNYHLTCEDTPDDIVEVHMLDSDGNLVAGYQPTLVQENGSNLTITELSESGGVAQFRVTTSLKSNLGSYDLKASLTTGSQTFTDTDQIEYVAYKFEVADKYLVAGQNEQVTVNVKACDTSGELIDLGYSGKPTATFSYERPTSAAVISDDLYFNAELNDSNREANINFKESGVIRVTITDPDFECDDERCPVEDDVLKGQFDVYARPWKIAICKVVETADSTNTNPATTTGTPGFLPGGSSFSASYIPIVHGDSKGSVTDECDYPFTGNYGLDNGPLALTYSVSYPTVNPQNGTITPTTIPSFDSDNLTQTIDHSWSEVGTLQLQTDATYLTMDLDSDIQDVGRFYPKYFQVINDPVWNYPGLVGNKQDFIYMNQPFEGVEFYVEALNLQGDSVQNYGNFDQSITADFALYEPNIDYTSRFHSPTPDKEWARISEKSIGTFTLYNSTPSAVCISELCWQKATASDGYEDGPFNTSGGTDSTISITETGTNSDPIDYQSTGDPRLLTEQPTILFGRAVISSVGGVTDSTMNVPLKVEFWNGSGFETNGTDDSSNLLGVSIVSSNHHIWVDDGATAANVSLADGGVVSSGASSSITVSQSEAVRQQTQVWLELNSGSNVAPWLRYRWEDDNRTEVDGEEEPSAVITFGIFRGNDRVIFRGESGLTGQ